MPPANITLYATPQAIATDDELVSLLGEHFEVTLDPADPADSIDIASGDCELSVEDNGAVHLYFMELTKGSDRVHQDAVQSYLRQQAIAYEWSHEMYVGNDGYAHEYRYWQPGWDAELVRGEGGALPEDFWKTHQHLDDAALGAAVRAWMTFTFDPPVKTA